MYTLATSHHRYFVAIFVTLFQLSIYASTPLEDGINAMNSYNWERAFDSLSKALEHDPHNVNLLRHKIHCMHELSMVKEIIDEG